MRKVSQICCGPAQLSGHERQSSGLRLTLPSAAAVWAYAASSSTANVDSRPKKPAGSASISASCVPFKYFTSALQAQCPAR